MSIEFLYPKSPTGIPQDLTKAKASYQRQAMLAMLGLITFMSVYLALAVCFGLITYNTAHQMIGQELDLMSLLIVFCSGLLTIFMVKSLLVVKKPGNPGGVEVSADDEPELFAFLHQLSDEIGAPRPHRVFITPEVNAAVFYDLSLFNLFFPSKKNLIIGLGLVNVLNLGELKAVLAHEFGHFAQGSMVVGRWVYIAQQIIGHMVATRDWLDKVVRFISKIDLRIAWLGWLLGLIIWSIRSLMDTLFSLVVMAERALSREMEFNADLVAVSVTGSDALINALHKLQAADSAWQTALNVASSEARNGKLLRDLFAAQKAAIAEVGRVLDDKHYGATPEKPEHVDAAKHRIFTESMANPPQMWSTHPLNSDREENAKARYFPAEIDSRDAWLIFSDSERMREAVSSGFYRLEEDTEVAYESPTDAVAKRFAHDIYDPKYRGTYLSRNWVRNFESPEQIFNLAPVEGLAAETIAELYPQELSEQLAAARNLDMERHSLEALASGEMKPSGGVIRHRGHEIKKDEIPQALEEIANERREIADQLKQHDSLCRNAHIAAASQWNSGWDRYLRSLTSLMHCGAHLKAVVDNESALLSNTWSVITADGQIGYFEKRRMINACKSIHQVMKTVDDAAKQIQLSPDVMQTAGIENWPEQYPEFDLIEVSKKNWQDWCGAASERMSNISYVFGLIEDIAQDLLIRAEKTVEQHTRAETQPEQEQTEFSIIPDDYPVLLPGNEHVLQRKLDLWNRFQLAHGFLPTLSRLMVSAGVIGGTIYGGFFY